MRTAFLRTATRQSRRAGINGGKSSTASSSSSSRFRTSSSAARTAERMQRQEWRRALSVAMARPLELTTVVEDGIPRSFGINPDEDDDGT